MKTIKIVITFILMVSNTICQNNEYLKHIESIRNNEGKGKACRIISYESIRLCGLKDTTFLDYALCNLIHPNDRVYISDRNLLTAIPITKCTKSLIEMKGKVLDKEILIEIKTKDFDSTLNDIQKNENKDNISINGFYPFGSFYSDAKLQFESISMKINGKSLIIPDSAFVNLYEPNLCEYSDFTRNLMAYTSEDGKNIYLYIYGGSGADNYFAKLIFDQEKFVAKWVTDYLPLSCFGCFSKCFIGF